MYRTKVVRKAKIRTKIKIFKSCFKSRKHFHMKEHGSYFEVSPLQASSVTLTMSGDES